MSFFAFTFKVLDAPSVIGWLGYVRQLASQIADYDVVLSMFFIPLLVTQWRKWVWTRFMLNVDLAVRMQTKEPTTPPPEAPQKPPRRIGF